MSKERKAALIQRWVALTGFILRILPAGAALFATRSLVFGQSVDYYRHDWGWPATSAQLYASFWRNIGLWDSTSTGAPNYEPILHPVFLLWHALAPLAAPHVLLALTLLAAFAVYGYGIAACCRTLLGLPPAVAFLIGAIALLGPPIYNKTVAGHIYYLIALATYPWTIRFAFSRSGSDLRDSVSASALAALSAIQIQLFVFSVLTIIVGALRRHPRVLCVRLAAVVGACALVLPQLIAFAQPDVLNVLQPLRTTGPWEYNNSSPVSLALISQGYAPHYYLHALTVMRLALAVHIISWLLVVTAAVAFVRSIRQPMMIGLVGLWLFSFTLVAGAFGPASGLLLLAFQRLQWFNVFRELYHFAGPEWTLLCVIAGAIGKPLLMRSGKIVAACVLALLAVPWISPNFAGQLVSQIPSAHARQAVLDEAIRPGDDRFLIMPSEWPVGPKGRTYGGEDPLAYAIGDHPSANSYTIHGVVEAAAAYTEENNPAAEHWRAVAGIGYVISRSDLQSYLTMRFPPLHRIPRYIAKLVKKRHFKVSDAVRVSPTCMLCAYSSLPVVAEAADSKNGDSFILLSDYLAGSGHLSDSRDAAASFDVTDPSIGWVDAAQWDWLDPRIALLDRGVLTWSTTSLRLPTTTCCRRWAHVLLLAGRLATDTGRLRVPMGRALWVSLPPSSTKIHVEAGLAVVDAFASRLPSVPPAVVESHFDAVNADLSFSWRNAYGSGTVPAQTRFIVLKQTFSPSWKLWIGKGHVLRHFRASGYANGWEVSVPGATEVKVHYERGSLGRWLLPISFSLWLLIAVAAVALRPRESKV